MNKSGPIIIIDDDRDDQELYEYALKALDCKNDIICFDDGESAFKYLDSGNVMPFLILSDVRLPGMESLELKKKIRQHNASRINCIPYLFFTTAASHRSVCEAYSGSAQGFFMKPYNMDELETVLKNIVVYWQCCMEPKFAA